MQNYNFSLKLNKIILNPWRSPLSLPHLIIGMKFELLAH
jgi:hypothetical protein